MNGHKTRGASRNRSTRTIKVSPTTRAIRSALVASATLLALAGTGSATAAGFCLLTSPATYLCTGNFTNSVEDDIPVVYPDMTVVIGLDTGGTTVNPAMFDTGITTNWSGHTTVVSYADISTYGADGVQIYGDTAATFDNFGNINTYVTAAGQNALDINADGNVYVTNGGSMLAGTGGAANVTAVDVYSDFGSVTFDNQAGGIIIAGANSGDSVAIAVDVGGGGTVTNNGDILASSVSGNATGIDAFSLGGITITNNGDLNVATGAVGGGNSTGIDVFTVFGDADVTTGADSTMTVGGYGDAVGINAYSVFYDSHINNQGTLDVTSYNGAASGIVVGYAKYADIDNGGAITVAAYGGNATGIGLSVEDDANVYNNGSITVFTSAPGAYAAGIMVNSNGSVTINNAGNVSVTSAGDGSGMGLLPYAEGADGVGLSGISVYGGGGQGELLLGGANDVNVLNSVNTYVNVGGNGTGMQGIAMGAGSVYFNNSGAVTVLAGGYATGVFGYVNGAGAYIQAYNTGNISATAGFDAYGMDLTATDGSVTVHNDAGLVSASGYYYATGIHATGYTGASVTGDGGASATAGGLGLGTFNATAIEAYSYNGAAEASSGGDVDASVYAISMQGAVVGQGLYAYSHNANATANADGTVDVYAGGYGYAGVIALGVYAGSYDGNAYAGSGEGSTVTVEANGNTNDGYGVIAGGLVASSYNGDVTVTSQGTVSVTATDNPDAYVYHAAQSFGVYAYSYNGDVTVSNTGSISATSNGTSDNYYGAEATGISAYSYDGDVTVTSSGSISAAVNSGYATKYGAAVGVDAYSYNGDTTVNLTGGSVTVTGTYANGTGVDAYTKYGTTTVNSDADITVTSDGSAQGIYAHNGNGDVIVTTGADSDITVTSAYGSATGIYAYNKYGAVVDVTNAGDITATGAFSASGIVATIYNGGTIDVTNSGAISVSADYYATGISANSKYSADGDITITNTSTGDISVTAANSAVGISAQTKYDTVTPLLNAGDIVVTNDGGVSATATGSHYVDPSNNLYNYGTAIGIAAQGYYGVDVTNNGSITTDGYYGSLGIIALSSYGDVDVTNSATGSITVNAGGSYFYGPYAYGIAAVTSDGSVSVTNAGSLSVDADTAEFVGNSSATGVLAQAVTGNVTVNNSGTIDVSATSDSVFYAPTATGVSTYAVFGDTLVSNTDSISAYAHSSFFELYGTATATGVDAINLFGDQETYNSGSISAEARAYYGAASATGVYMIGYYGQYVNTAGGSSITASAFGGDFSEYALSDATGVSAISLSTGEVSVYNEGAISATADTGADTSYSSALAIGVDAEALVGNTTVTNTAGASISATATAGYGDAGYDNQADAYGVIAYNYDGDISVLNEGAISATAHSGGDTGYANAIGVSALIGVGGYGDIDVNNGGSITATAEDSAIGVLADSYGPGPAYGDVAVRNSADGSIVALATEGEDAVAYGVLATGYDSFAYNAGDISASAGGYVTATATGVYLFGQYGTFDSASGSSVSATATSDDAYAGGVVVNAALASAYSAGSISASATGEYSAFATGVLVNGVISTFDSGTGSNVTATASADDAYAAGVAVIGTIAEAYNNGHVGASATGDATAFATGVYIDGTIAIFDSEDGSSVNASASADDAYASGVVALGTIAQGYNASDITVTANGSDTAYATGMYLSGTIASFNGTVGGSISATATAGNGAYAYGLVVDGDAIGQVYAEGDFSAHATSYNETGDAYAIAIAAYGFNSIAVLTTADASIVATASADDEATAVGLGVFGFYTVDVGNNAAINVSASGLDGDAIGMYVGSYHNDIEVDNHGVINSAFNGGGYAYGIYAISFEQGVTLNNYANVTATGGEIAAGVFIAGDTSTYLYNHATITGTGADYNVAVWSGTSSDHIYNYGTLNGAIWTSSGDDFVYIEAGSTWNPGQTPSYFGDGDDTIVNNGTINLVDSTIYMEAYDVTGNAFYNNALINVSGDNYISMGDGPQALIPSLNPLPFYNYGTIDFQDGAPDDYLMIVGDFAGDGELNVDVEGLASDILYIDGSVVTGTVNTINVDLLELPDLSESFIPIVYVSGISVDGNFELGDVEWDDVNTFVTVDFDIVAHIDADNSDPDVFGLGINVTGLTDPGTLAASIPSAVQNLMNSQIGTWRQRMGVIDKFNDGAVSLWARVWQDRGEFDPEHEADFGPGGNFDWHQKNSGVEGGIDFAVTDEFSLGLLVGKSQADTHLVGLGHGSSDIDADTWGIYGTWISPTGFYLDASYRWMSFDVDLSTPIGDFEQDGDAEAFNVELGYAWTLSGGLKIEPQLQYTHTSVDELQVISTSTGMTFQSDGGDSSRGRIGVALRKSFGDADTGWMWTPYGTLSAVHEWDGENFYIVDDALVGEVDLGGTSAMLELGFTGNHRNWAVYGGLTWTDGGPVDSVFGGHLGVRYTFGAPAPAPVPVAPPPAKTCADLDDDGDGINNCDDKCLGTPAGTAVGPDGCPVPPPEPVMEPKPYRG